MNGANQAQEREPKWIRKRLRQMAKCKYRQKRSVFHLGTEVDKSINRRSSGKLSKLQGYITWSLFYCLNVAFGLLHIRLLFSTFWPSCLVNILDLTNPCLPCVGRNFLTRRFTFVDINGRLKLESEWLVWANRIGHHALSSDWRCSFVKAGTKWWWGFTHQLLSQNCQNLRKLQTLYSMNTDGTVYEIWTETHKNDENVSFDFRVKYSTMSQ